MEKFNLALFEITKRQFGKKEAIALDYLLAFEKENPGQFVSPTTFGNYYGRTFLGSTGHHSSTGSPPLIKLTKTKFVERNKKGHYRLVIESFL